MNKKIGIIIGICLIILAVGGSIIYFNKDKLFNNNAEETTKNPINENEEKNPSEDEEKDPNENEFIVDPIFTDEYYVINEGDYTYASIEGNIVRDVMSNEIIYDSSKKYATSKLEDLTFLNNVSLENKEAIDEYLKYFFYIFREKSKSSFSRKDMSIILSFAADMIYTPRDENYMKSLAKRYFNVDNFEMVTGTYDVLFSKLDREKYTILKKDNYYITAGIEARGIDLDYDAYLTDIKVDGNKVTVYYDYAAGMLLNGGCYSSTLSKEEKEACRIGTYKVEITMDKEKQIFAVDSIEYTKK